MPRQRDTTQKIVSLRIDGVSTDDVVWKKASALLDHSSVKPGSFDFSNGQSRFVTTRGKDLISADGKPLLLKGINLGNWLLPEGYMFKFKTANSPRLIQTVINELVGEDEGRRFWKTYQENYITQEDIRFIKQSGFNSVRVPFSYRLFVSDS